MGLFTQSLSVGNALNGLATFLCPLPTALAKQSIRQCVIISTSIFVIVQISDVLLPEILIVKNNVTAAKAQEEGAGPRVVAKEYYMNYRGLGFLAFL